MEEEFGDEGHGLMGWEGDGELTFVVHRRWCVRFAVDHGAAHCSHKRMIQRY